MNQKPGLSRAREQGAWELSVRGLSQRQIANVLQAEGLGLITHQAVSKALRRVEQRLGPELDARALAVKARQAAALEHVYNKAMRESERSKGRARKISRRVSAGPAGPRGLDGSVVPPAQTTTELKDRCGDPAYLRAAMEAQDRLAKLFGTYAQIRPESPVPAQPDASPGVVIYIPDNGRDGGATATGQRPDNGRCLPTSMSPVC
jgi:hypothetical protein